MPELPEVETTRRGIEPHIVGHAIAKVIVRRRDLRQPIPESLPADIHNQTVRSVIRRGKYLLIELETGTLIIHLGMSGSLRISKSDNAVKKHDHVDIITENGCILRFHDPRRFGLMLWEEGDIQQHPLIRSLGVEPLENLLNGSYLYTKSRNRRQSVKTMVMDSHIVVGVGNIYANESLFMAGIHPKRTANRISKVRYERLADAIKTVLSDAIEMGGTTLRDFVSGNNQPGYFSQQLSVYGKAGQPCPCCQSPIKQITLGQRSSFYCKNCQR